MIRMLLQAALQLAPAACYHNAALQASACYQNAARRPHVTRTRPSRLPQTFSTSNLKLQTFSMSNLTSRTSPSKNNILHQDTSCISPSKNNILHQNISCISLSRNNILHQDMSCISPSKSTSPASKYILHKKICNTTYKNNILHQDVSCISPSKNTSPAEPLYTHVARSAVVFPTETPETAPPPHTHPHTIFDRCLHLDNVLMVALNSSGRPGHLLWRNSSLCTQVQDRPYF